MFPANDVNFPALPQVTNGFVCSCHWFVMLPGAADFGFRAVILAAVRKLLY